MYCLALKKNSWVLINVALFLGSRGPSEPISGVPAVSLLRLCPSLRRSLPGAAARPPPRPPRTFTGRKRRKPRTDRRSARSAFGKRASTAEAPSDPRGGDPAPQANVWPGWMTDAPASFGSAARRSVATPPPLEDTQPARCFPRRIRVTTPRD